CDAETIRQDREAKQREEREAEKQYRYDNPETYMAGCNIPRKYIHCAFEGFQGNDKLIKTCQEYRGGGLVLSGNTGCGKTFLSIAFLREYVKRGKAKPWFVTVPDLLLEIRSSFRDEADRSEADIVDEYSTIPFLVLDDLGSEKTTEFTITTLYIILDRRDREMLDTIITTNLTLAEISEKLSARIASRLAGMRNIKINMPDYRKLRRVDK
ncbi:MAG: ATP-binding protein, partial [Deltaproteobacteria bacterium]|nr:ATP-binding protein [Deltaproteobacteria bacterium]